MGLIMAFTQYPVLEQMYWKWKNKSFQETSFFLSFNYGQLSCVNFR